MFTFTPDQPYVYSQTIPAPLCDPLSITRSSLSPNQLYVDCRDVRSRGSVFLALLAQSLDHQTRLQWSFQQLPGYQNLDGAGAFVEVAALNTMMMLYLHEESGYLEVNGVDSGYISSLSLPRGCGHLVRATPTGSGGVVLLECSSERGSEEITNVHTFNISAAVLRRVIDSAPYSVCPLRFTADGQTAAIFTQHGIIVVDLGTGDHVNITASGPVYDGLLVRAGGTALYVVYSSPGGLHRSYVPSLASESSPGVLVRFEGSDSICAHRNCSLLALLDSDTVLAALGHEVALFSISTLRQVASAPTKYQPSRHIFQRSNGYNAGIPVPTSSSHLSPHSTSAALQSPSPPSREFPIPYSTSPQAPSPPPSHHQVTSPTPTLTPPPRETMKPNLEFTVSISSGAIGGIVVAVLLTVVVAVVAVVAVVVIFYRKPEHHLVRSCRARLCPSLGQTR